MLSVNNLVFCQGEEGPAKMSMVPLLGVPGCSVTFSLVLSTESWIAEAQEVMVGETTNNQSVPTPLTCTLVVIPPAGTATFKRFEKSTEAATCWVTVNTAGLMPVAEPRVAVREEVRVAVVALPGGMLKTQ